MDEIAVAEISQERGTLVKQSVIPVTLLVVAGLYVVGLTTPLVIDLALLDLGALFTMVYIVIPLSMLAMGVMGVRGRPLLVHVSHGLGLSLAGLTAHVVASAQSGAPWLGLDVLDSVPAGAGFYALLVAALLVVVISLGGAAQWRTGRAPTEWETKGAVAVVACSALLAASQLWPSTSVDLWGYNSVGRLVGALSWLLGVPVLVGLAASAKSKQGLALALGVGAGNVVIYVSSTRSEFAAPLLPRDVAFFFCSGALCVVTLWSLGPLRQLAESVGGRSTSPTFTQAHWAPDPWHRHSERFWNGREWTAQVRNGSTVRFDPPSPSAVSVPPPPPPPRRP